MNEIKSELIGKKPYLFQGSVFIRKDGREFMFCQTGYNYHTLIVMSEWDKGNRLNEPVKVDHTITELHLDQIFGNVEAFELVE